MPDPPPNSPGYQPTCLYESAGIQGIEQARKQVASAGAAGAHVTVWILPLIRERARIHGLAPPIDRVSCGREEVEPVPDPSVYFSAVSDPRNRAQIGFGAWQSDYPSAAGFIPPLLSCSAYTPESPDTNANLAAFCDPSIDAKMTRATALQATNQPAATLLWQQIENELLAQAPVLPTINRRNVDFLSERVGNYQYNPQWSVLLSQLSVK